MDIGCDRYPHVTRRSGQGWLLAPITSAGIHEVDASLSGAASGMTNTMHQLGGPIGLSIIVFSHQI